MQHMNGTRPFKRQDSDLGLSFPLNILVTVRVGHLPELTPHNMEERLGDLALHYLFYTKQYVE